MLFLANPGLEIAIDCIAGVIVIGFALIGLKKGFIKTLFITCGALISLLLAILLAGLVAKFLQSQWGALDFFADKFHGIVLKLFPDSSKLAISDATPELLAQFNIPSWIIDKIMNVKDSLIASGVNPTIDNVIAPIFGQYALLIISGIIIYAIIRTTLIVVANIIQKAHTFKPFGFFDKFLGVIFGILYSFVIIDFTIMIIGIIPLGFCQDIILAVQNTKFVAFIDNLNLFYYLTKVVVSDDGIIAYIKQRYI